MPWNVQSSVYSTTYIQTPGKLVVKLAFISFNNWEITLAGVSPQMVHSCLEAWQGAIFCSNQLQDDGNHIMVLRTSDTRLMATFFKPFVEQIQDFQSIYYPVTCFLSIPPMSHYDNIPEWIQQGNLERQVITMVQTSLSEPASMSYYNTKPHAEFKRLTLNVLAELNIVMEIEASSAQSLEQIKQALGIGNITNNILRIEISHVALHGFKQMVSNRFHRDNPLLPMVNTLLHQASTVVRNSLSLHNMSTSGFPAATGAPLMPSRPRGLLANRSHAISAFARAEALEPPDCVNATQLVNMGDRREIPLHLICPISKKIMDNPVYIVNTDGTFDDKQLRYWIQKQGTHPCSGRTISEAQIIPDHPKSEELNAFMQGIRSEPLNKRPRFGNE